MEQLIAHEHGDWQVVIEDGERVCHAYLLRGATIVSDVWLANRQVPTTPEWEAENAVGALPFLNPVPYVDERDMGLAELVVDQIQPQWVVRGDHAEVELRVGDDLLAVLTSDETPGRSRYAATDGPLARRL